MSSLPQETRRAPVASVNRANSLSGILLAYYVNQGISASFSPLFSDLQCSFLICLSKSSTDAVFPSGSPGSCRGWTLALGHLISIHNVMLDRNYLFMPYLKINKPKFIWLGEVTHQIISKVELITVISYSRIFPRWPGNRRHGYWC